MKKTIGFILLLAGVSLIAWSVYASYQIFQGLKPAPQIFQAPKDLASQKEPEIPIKGQDIEKQIQETLREQLGQLIPPNTVSEILNLISWSIFASILIFAGSKVGGLGVSLLR